jgi:hypothetical protein
LQRTVRHPAPVNIGDLLKISAALMRRIYRRWKKLASQRTDAWPYFEILTQIRTGLQQNGVLREN